MTLNDRKVRSTIISKATALLNNDESPSNAEVSTRDVAVEEVQRTVEPEVFTVDRESGDTPAASSITGVIALLRIDETSDFVEDFEAALESGDSDRLHELSAHIEASAKRDSTPTDTPIADLTYNGERVVDRIEGTTDDTFAAGVAPYKGGEVDPSSFEVREHRSADDESAYEYRVLIVPPERTEAEHDADASVPTELQEPALEMGQTRAHFPGLAVAAGVVAVAAIWGSGSASLTPPQVDMDAEVDAGASFDDLRSQRQEAHS